MANDPMHLRTCYFRPYRKGYGPSFRLQTFDSGRTDSMGKTIIRYQLRESARLDNGTIEHTVIFEGSDFACSPCVAIDSDEAIASLMCFLTLRPGDTDADYFDAYNDIQRDFAQCHAESMSALMFDRFGER